MTHAGARDVRREGYGGEGRVRVCIGEGGYQGSWDLERTLDWEWSRVVKVNRSRRSDTETEYRVRRNKEYGARGRERSSCPAAVDWSAAEKLYIKKSFDFQILRSDQGRNAW